MAWKILSPVKGYNGTSAGVTFADGAGMTANKQAAEWLREHGYTVEDAKKQTAAEQAAAEQAAAEKAERQAGSPSKPKAK